MPAITLHPPPKHRGTSSINDNPLPNLLQTPSGLAILEIQGTVNTPCMETQDYAVIGKLTFPLYDPVSKGADDTTWQKRVYLYVGKHQRLTGEVKNLPKPIAVIRRKQDGREDLEIAEVVHWKVLFAHRPEPVGTFGGGEEGV